MWSSFQTKKLNIHRELELELAANLAELENQAELVPGPDPEKMKQIRIFFKKWNLRPSSFSTQEDIGICACIAKIRGVSLITLTVQHPVDPTKNPLNPSANQYTTQMLNRRNAEVRLLTFILRSKFGHEKVPLPVARMDLVGGRAMPHQLSYSNGSYMKVCPRKAWRVLPRWNSSILNTFCASQRIMGSQSWGS